MDDEMVEAVVVEADGIEQAAGGLDGPRRRVADPRLGGDGLGDDAAEFGEVDEAGHLAGVAERAAGDQAGVAEGQPAEGDGEVGHKRILTPEARRARGTRPGTAGVSPR